MRIDLFSLTRSALSTGERAKQKFLSVGRWLNIPANGSVPVGVWFTALLATLSAGATPGLGRQVLSGHRPVPAANLHALGRLETTNSLNLAIGLPLRHQASLARLLQELYDPASPNFHRYLTPAQFADQFGPTETDYRAVIAFAQANGLTVTATHPNRTLLDVKGTVASIEKAFHLAMHVYQHPTEGRTFYAPDAEPSLDLPTQVLHISGLDSYRRPRPLNLGMKPLAIPNGATPATGSGPSGTFFGNDFRAAYAPGVSLTGAGESVGLLEFDGFYPEDITAYANQTGLPQVPLEVVLLDGFSGTPGYANVEVALDIDMAICMAPGLSSVIIYEGYVTDSILNRMATDNRARQLSASWSYPIDAATEQIFQQFAAQGQSFFNASGDYDAWTGPIPSPCDDPYVTIVGGTTLTTFGPGGGWLSETVWNWGYDGSGGGISTTYPIPSWQQGISMAANQGSTTMRNIPDVALTADNVYLIANNGQSGSIGGTSAAAPLWAGFIALVNQQAAASGRPPVGFLNPALYALGQQAAYTLGLHDITTGNNRSDQSPSQFDAVAGYDLCTGWGTPNGSNLVKALVAPPNALEVRPGLGFAASGPPGGPFTPVAQSYALKNAGGMPLNWTLANTSAWLSVTATSGHLAPSGLPAVVAARLNSAASNLLAGTYTTTIWFTNLNDGFVQDRQFVLLVATVPPVINAQPTDQSVLAGRNAAFSISAAGTDLHYYWKRNGSGLADGGHVTGSATSTLTLSSVAAADAGVYSVIVSNAAGQVSSVGAALVVYSPAAGELVQNGGFETGDFSGWALTGNTNLAAVTANSFAVHSGTYGAQLGMAGALGFLSQTVPTVSGSLYLVSAWLGSPDGIAPNEFQVLWDGRTLVDVANWGAIGWTNPQAIVTATGSSTVLGFGFRDDPSYLALDDVSVLALEVASPPNVTSQPIGQQVMAGGTATFSAAAAGTSPLTYQWRLNGTNLSDGGGIGGATTGQLIVSNATAANEGAYSLLVSNRFGLALSREANLVVLPVGATVVTFDDLPETIDGYGVNNGYKDLNWSNVGELDSLGFVSLAGASGYSAGVISPNNVAFNGGGLPANISAARPFNLYAAYLTAGWNDNLQVRVLGLVGSNQVAFSNTCILSATTPTLVPFNFTNVTEVDFVSSGGTHHLGYQGSGKHFVMDNVAVSFVGPVSITHQPANQTIAAGEAAIFSIGAVGGVPLSFQWRKNGVALSDGGNISCATTTTLMVSNSAPADAGVYSVIVSNSYGAVTSADAALTVYFSDPANLVQNGGFETGDFAGWTQSGNINSLTVTTNVAAVYSGVYGAKLSTTSAGLLYADLQQNLTTMPGALYQISLWLKSVPASGHLPYNLLDVIWDGSVLAEEADLGPTDWRRLEFVGAAAGSATVLDLRFFNQNGYYAVDDISVNLITNSVSPPILTSEPIGQSVPLGGTAVFQVAAVGVAPLNYQWLFNGTYLAGATGSALTLTNVQPKQAGDYAVLVLNSQGTTLSSKAALTVLVPPRIMLQPVRQLVQAGCGANFNVVAFGTQPLGYLWYKDGVALNGQTNSNFTIAGAQTIDLGAYCVVVTNSCGSATSSKAVLAWNHAPVATPDVIERFAAGGIRVRASLLAANDTDEDGDSLAVVGVSLTSAAGGMVGLDNGWIHYQPPAGFTNTDTFAYTVSDGHCYGWSAGVVTVQTRGDDTPVSRLTIDSAGDGSYQIGVDGRPGATYRLQYCENPSKADWQDLAAGTADAFGVFQYNYQPPTNAPVRFYRAVWP